jgi:hypothetical protein
MFAKWLEEYQSLYEKLGFLSKLSAFLVATFAILSLYSIAHFFYVESYGLRRLFEIHALFPAVIFQLMIFLVFALKFASSFFHSKKAFIFSRILWLAGLLLLISYWSISRPEPLPFEVYSTYPDPSFRHSSPIFDGLARLYLILSPLRQIITIIIALIKSK